MLLSETITALCTAARADGCTKSTIGNYKRRLDPLVSFLGDMPIAEVTTNDLRRFIVSLMDRNTRWVDHPYISETDGGLSPFTVAGYVKVVKRLFNFCESEGIIDANPARRIKTPKPKRTEPKHIKEADFLALLATTEPGRPIDKRDKAVLFFLADTGCRVKGLCGLRLGDLDFREGLAKVTEKGDKSRLVPFSEPTAQALHDWLEIRPEVDHDFVFVTLANRCWGTKLSENGTRHLLKVRAEEAGVTGAVNPHSFRHAFARIFLLTGGDLASLSDLMGHSDVQITKENYAVFTVADLQKKHAKHGPMAHLFGGNGDDH